MSRNFIAIILGAGVAALAYRYIGQRLGYGNTKRVWVVTGSVFVIGYLIFISTLLWLIHI